ncbi:MAG: YHS domain-containing protein, partial [Gaiellaceae bacterium]
PREAQMAEFTDPVCGMVVDPAAAAGESRFGTDTYFFCSSDCLRAFEAEPEKFAGKTVPGSAQPGSRDFEPERHEPPHTTTGGFFTAPKFGAAGSGGAEYEPGPEKHDEESGR